jgi:hypothetical protein
VSMAQMTLKRKEVTWTTDQWLLNVMQTPVHYG